MKKIFSLLFAFLLGSVFFLLAPSAQAATIYVNSATGDDALGTGSVGSPYKTVSRGYTAAAASGDVLDLTGTFTWTDVDELTDAAGSGFTLNKSLTVRGQGVGSTIVQANALPNTSDRAVFAIASGRTVTLQDLTVRHGSSVLGVSAGGVSNYGTLTLLRTRVTANRYNSVSYYGAGGVFSDTNTTITLTNSTIDNNTFTGRYYGSGGLYALQNVPVVIDGSTFNNNTAVSDNAGTFAYSYAAPSGGLGTFRFGLLRITNSTFTLNSTNAYGGAMQIYYKDSTKITNTTVVNNTATLGAGGILYQSEWDGYTLFLKNSILANNTGGGVSSDFHAYDASSGNRVTSNGYNIVETSANKTFAATGDLTGNQASLNIDTALADNSTASGTQTLALLTGSVAINAGDPANAANSGIAIPTADQRNVVRMATTDIGAYEFSAPASYTLTYTAGANGVLSGSSTQTVLANANGSAVTAVPDAGYSFVQWSDASTTNPRTDTNVTGNVTVSATFADLTAPVLSSVAISGDATSAIVTWTTNELGSSQVAYGTTTAYGATTTLADTSPRVTSHSVALSGLETCTTYHYRVYSADAAANSSTSTDATFMTGGCTSGSGGGSVTSAPFVPPSGVGDGEKDVLVGMYETRDLGVITTKGINSLAYIGAKATFRTQSDMDTLIKSGTMLLSGLDLLENKVDLTFSPASQLVSLRIGQSANVDLDGDKIDDLQVTFQAVWVNRAELTMKALKPAQPEFVTTDLTPVTPPVASSPCAFTFTRPLKLGQSGEDVKALQGCLKQQGYTPLLKNGKPVETLTTYFGPATRDALVRYQKGKRLPGTGYFGPMTLVAMGKSAFALR